MCKSLSQGGQRCYSHPSGELVKAWKTMDALEGDKIGFGHKKGTLAREIDVSMAKSRVQVRMRAHLVDVASTETGKALLEAHAQAVANGTSITPKNKKDAAVLRTLEHMAATDQSRTYLPATDPKQRMAETVTKFTTEGQLLSERNKTVGVEVLRAERRERIENRAKSLAYSFTSPALAAVAAGGFAVGAADNPKVLASAVLFAAFAGFRGKTGSGEHRTRSTDAGLSELLARDDIRNTAEYQIAVAREKTKKATAR